MWGWLYRLASPPGFYRFADACLPWLTALWLALFAVGLVWGLVFAPADYQQGEAYRIIFVHVPAAWMSLFVYTAMTVAAGVGLIWNFKLSGVFIAAAAPLGAMFTFLTLVTGSVWGRPMWGTWWAGDARLVSELILLFIYLGIIALQRMTPDERVARQLVAIMVIVGFVNIPIIHYSVEWWTTLHQPASILKFSAPSVHPAMLFPLLVMALAFMAFFAMTVMLAMQNELLQRGRGGLEKGQ